MTDLRSSSSRTLPPSTRPSSIKPTHYSAIPEWSKVRLLAHTTADAVSPKADMRGTFPFGLRVLVIEATDVACLAGMTKGNVDAVLSDVAKARAASEAVSAERDAIFEAVTTLESVMGPIPKEFDAEDFTVRRYPPVAAILLFEFGGEEEEEDRMLDLAKTIEQIFSLQKVTPCPFLVPVTPLEAHKILSDVIRRTEWNYSWSLCARLAAQSMSALCSEIADRERQEHARAVATFDDGAATDVEDEEEGAGTTN